MSMKKTAVSFFLVLIIASLLVGFNTPANPTQQKYDDNAPITVWIDADRQPAFDAYVKAHPDKAKLLKAVTVDRETFRQKYCCSITPIRVGRM
jgi:YD repeat-containing protein